MTPEGKMKQAIRNVLSRFEDDVYVHMPVQYGYGAPSLDYIGCVRGIMFAIEAKKPGGKPTVRQEGTIEHIQKAGGRVFVINNLAQLEELEQWITQVITIAARTEDLARLRGLPVVENDQR
jgi:hypothetical protein